MTLTSNIELHESENNSFLVKHKSTHKYVKMGAREAEYLKYLMGDEDTDVANSEYTGDLNEEEQLYLLQKFKEWGFLDQEGHPINTEEPEGRERRWTLNWRTNDITTIKFLSVNPDQWLTATLPLIRKLVHPAAIILYTLMILFSGFLILTDPEATTLLKLEKLTLPGYLGIYLMVLVTTAIHEIAHGMVCKYYGGRVNQMGMMLFYFSPAMFCDVSDTYVFKRKRHKLAVLFAGIFSQWIMSAAAVLIYSLFRHNGVNLPLLFYYAIANLGLSMINMIPLVKLDGYWMLSHGLGIVNLRAKAFRTFYQWVNPWSKNRNGGNEQKQMKAQGQLERAILLMYGLAAVLFTPLFWCWGLYSIQKRLDNMLGDISLLITAGIACVLLYHMTKFIRLINKPA